MAAVPAVLGPDGTPLRPKTGPAAFGFGGNAYRGADRWSTELASWVANLASADSEIMQDRDQLVARSRDLLRNNGWASGLVDNEVNAAVGSGLTLSAQPNWKALGIELDEARKVGDQFEAAYEEWATDPRKLCDLERKRSIGRLQRLAYSNYFGVDGEALALLHIKRFLAFPLVVQLIDPDRLSNPNGAPDTSRLRGGVETNADGVPIAYHIRRAHPNDSLVDTALESQIWDRVPANDNSGLPRVIHAIRDQRIGQTRGVGQLVSVLLEFRMADKQKRLEQQAAVVNAIWAATLESNFDGEELREMLGDTSTSDMSTVRSEFYDESAIKVDGVRIPHLFPGDKLTLTQPTRPNANYEAFERSVLRHLAAGTGQTYEQVSRDWSKTNYSSARAALLEYWRGVIARRAMFVEDFVRPIYMAFLMVGFIGNRFKMPANDNLPDVFEMPAAWTKARWIGPARGWVDPTKEAQGALMRMDAGLTTLQAEAAEQGLDWRDVLAQQKIERDERKRLGLPEPDWSVIQQNSLDKSDEDEEREGQQARDAA